MFEEVHKESHLHVDKMEAEFIRNAIATFDPCICLRVKDEMFLNRVEILFIFSHDPNCIQRFTIFGRHVKCHIVSHSSPQNEWDFFIFDE